MGRGAASPCLWGGGPTDWPEPPARALHTVAPGRGRTPPVWQSPVTSSLRAKGTKGARACAGRPDTPLLTRPGRHAPHTGTAGRSHLVWV